MSEPKRVYLVVDESRSGDAFVVLACTDEAIAEEISARFGGHVEAVVLVGGPDEQE